MRDPPVVLGITRLLAAFRLGLYTQWERRLARRSRTGSVPCPGLVGLFIKPISGCRTSAEPYNLRWLFSRFPGRRSGRYRNAQKCRYIFIEPQVLRKGNLKLKVGVAPLVEPLKPEMAEIQSNIGLK